MEQINELMTEAVAAVNFYVGNPHTTFRGGKWVRELTGEQCACQAAAAAAAAADVVVEAAIKYGACIGAVADYPLLVLNYDDEFYMPEFSLCLAHAASALAKQAQFLPRLPGDDYEDEYMSEIVLGRLELAAGNELDEYFIGRQLNGKWYRAPQAQQC